MSLPRDEADLAEAIRAASGPVRVQGGGTRGMAGLGIGPGAALSAAGLQGVSLYEPGAMTLVVAAGTPLAEVEAVLAAEGQRLPFEPMDHRGLLGTQGTPTIGGVVAGNVSGPRRIQAGAARDSLLGLRMVDGAGMLIRNGGRVMKNVTGYDLARLMAGSRGRLGVITEVALRVLPMPEAEATLVVGAGDPGRAVAALSAALGSPYDVSGAAFWPGRGALVRIEGFAPSVATRAEALGRRLAAFGPVTLEEGEQSAALWQAVRDVAPFHGKPGDVWRFSVRPSDAPELAARLGAEELLFDWGGGLVWARIADGTDARARMGGIAGHGTLVRAGAETLARIAMLHPEPAPVARLSARMCAAFDPRGIFSPRAGAEAVS